MDDGLILASASPRRQALLARLGLPFQIIPSDVEEIVPDGLPPATVAEELAVLKAQTVAARYPAATVIGADTVVALPDHPPRLLGKPVDDADAAAMLRALRGRWHQVSTGIAVVRAGGVWRDVVISQVRMSEYCDADISAYVATGESRDKAGAYALQGLAGRLVAEVRGSELAVVGLPLRRLAELLIEAGVVPDVAPDAIVDRWAR